MTILQLRQKQSLSLNSKIVLSQKVIRDFYDAVNGNIYVAFSGGKDSTVLLDIVRRMYPSTIAVYSYTGLEYPEIIKFVRSFENVEWVRPKKRISQVIEEYGFPFPSKETAGRIEFQRKYPSQNYIDKIPAKYYGLLNSDIKISARCCYWLKKAPAKKFQKESGLFPIIGIMATEGRNRESQWLQHGCNTFAEGNQRSAPLSFWTEKDIWDYIHFFNLPYSEIYNMGYTRTGCVGCGFGINLDNHPNRYQLLQKTHPKFYNYCVNTLGWKTLFDFCNIEYENRESLF